MLTQDERAQLTLSCRDTDIIPKVEDAGHVRQTADGPVQVMHNGVLIVEGCYHGAWMTDIIRGLRGHHEPQEEVVFHEIVERLAADTVNPTMIELGAFWAWYSLWLLHRLPATRAILVEPDPNNLEAGRRNVELNGRTAEMLQAAVGRVPAPPAPFPCESDGATRDIPTESLESLFERFEVPRVDVLLLDVQGAELDFLDGARSLLAARTRFVMVSTHHHMISGRPDTHQRCLDLLREAGAHVIAEHTVAESFSGDGLIAVSFDDRDADFDVDVSLARAKDSLFGDPVDDFTFADAQRREAWQRLASAEAEADRLRAEVESLRVEVESTRHEVRELREEVSHTSAPTVPAATLARVAGVLPTSARHRIGAGVRWIRRRAAAR